MMRERRRPLVLALIVSFLLIIFMGILFKLQIFDHKKLGNSQVVVAYEYDVPAARGDILDRNGNYLVSNRQGNSLIFNAVYFPAKKDQTKRNDEIYALIKRFEQSGLKYIDKFPIVYNSDGSFSYSTENGADDEIKWLKSKDILNLNDYATAENCMSALITRYSLANYEKRDARNIAAICIGMEREGFSKNNPYVFAEDLPIDFVASILENNNLFLGVENSVEAYREYSESTLAPHILGRISPIDPATYKSEKEKTNEKKIQAEKKGLSSYEIEDIGLSSYALNDYIGDSGIEQSMETYLKGKKGMKSIIKDTSGNTRETYLHEPVQGDNIILTIDKDLQRIAQDSLKRSVDELTVKSALQCAAATVVIDVNTGEILAAATYPSYDNNNFKENYAKISGDPRNPLWNRALQSTYEPGSTFKPAVAMGALEEGVINASTIITCNHDYKYLGHDFSCLGWHGPLNVTEGINKSCNIFFFETGRRLGIEKMNKWCSDLGLGQKSGVEVSEAAGRLAGPQYAEEMGRVWRPGDTVQAAIGQSDNQVTVLQLANYCSTIANGGTRYVPHFVKSIKSADYSETILDKTPQIAKNLGFHQQNLDLVRKGMLEVGTIGFCRTAFADLPVKAAAKTGTTQVKKVINGKDVEGNNGLLITYAPYDKPQIAIAVIVESADKGSYTARVASEIYKYYFSEKTIPRTQNYNVPLP